MDRLQRERQAEHSGQDMPVRMLALDLDGTLLTGDKRLTGRTEKALLAAGEAGILPVVVTGRPLAGLPEAVRRLSCIPYAITSNGASTVDLRSGERLRSACMDGETAVGIVRLLMARERIHCVFLDGRGYCEPRFLEMQYDYFRGKALAGYIQASRQATEDIVACIREHPHGVENIWCIARDREERDELACIFRSRWQVQTVLTAERDVEAGSTGADKGAAVCELASYLGIQKEEILAIGDNDNDLAMFRAAGTTVAMGNAQEHVKKQAHMVTDTNERDGAARIIESVTGAGH